MLELSEAALDDVFQALSNRSRRAMLTRLTDGPASLSELAAPLDMTLSAVEQHVKVLERCDLVRSRKAGRIRTCHLEPDTLRVTEKCLGLLRSDWEQRLDRLGDLLDESATDPNGKQ